MSLSAAAFPPRQELPRRIQACEIRKDRDGALFLVECESGIALATVKERITAQGTAFSWEPLPGMPDNLPPCPKAFAQLRGELPIPLLEEPSLAVSPKHPGFRRGAEVE